ncbi:isochorismatase family protein [Ramlibacter sp. RBP-2]|uniref:Isochorismatase family protein n=1 Tax=Ramlibacter lithotrophicus TaxID=2606681 RepID=A0A7X6I4S4_9BURK|nr:isochorismatase family protein [Ramlibacter lithotrophicus]NKE64344.1 isochorismatase family protein [Ramlibacter lithotrophicus]
MLLDHEECQLVLVDYQARLMPAIHESEAVLRNAMRLAQLAQLFEVPAWGTEQNPARLGENPSELKALCRKTLSKMHFGACADGLAELLRPAPRQGGNARSLPRHLQKAPAAERGTIVLAGCEAHVCLLQTALELIEEEFDLWVVTDACSSRTERNRDAAYDRLAAAGAELVTTEMVAFEWLRTAEHPMFKQVQALIK